MDERIVHLRTGSVCRDVRLVDYGSSDDSGEDKTKDKINHNVISYNDTLHTGRKRKSVDKDLIGVSGYKMLCTDGQSSFISPNKSVEILDENGNQQSVIDVCDIPLPHEVNNNQRNNTFSCKGKFSDNVLTIQSSTHRQNQRRTVISLTPQNTSRKVTFPERLTQKSKRRVIPPFSAEKNSNFQPSQNCVNNQTFPSPSPFWSNASPQSPFWSNASPQSELNSPLYGYHSPPSPIVTPSPRTGTTTSIPNGLSQTGSQYATPVKRSMPSNHSSFTETLANSLPNHAVSPETFYLSSSQVFLTSSLFSPRQRFLQNSCLVNKNQPSASPANQNKDVTEWKKQFKQTSDRYGVSYIDSHCHLDFLILRSQFKGSWEKFRTVNSDTFPIMYEGCVAVFCSPASFKPEGLWKDVAASKGVWLAFGCHPKSATDFSPTAEAGLYQCLSHSKVVALGEIGLDYSGTFRQHEEVQKEVFRKQIKIALMLNKPLVIHCRDADDDCFNIVSEMVPRNHKIHCHCFTGDYMMAKRWLDTFPNLYIGMTPLVTYKTAATTHNVARFIDLDRLLLETDAPYFVPRKIPKDEMIHSHPGMAVTVAEQVAYIKGCSVQEVLLTCRQNTRNMYGI